MIGQVQDVFFSFEDLFMIAMEVDLSSGDRTACERTGWDGIPSPESNFRRRTKRIVDRVSRDNRRSGGRVVANGRGV